MERLGRMLVRRRKAVLIATLVFVLGAAMIGGGVISRLRSGGFADPGSESAEAVELLQDRYGDASPNLVVLVTTTGARSVDDPAIEAVAAELANVMTDAGVVDVASYWSLGHAPPLRNDDGTRALLLGTIIGTDDEVQDTIRSLSPTLTRETDVAVVSIGGFAEVYRQMSETIEHDLVRAELIAFPITLVLLLFVFRGVIAAVLPLAVGVIAIFGALLALFLISLGTDVSIFALNLTTAMGLGLAIDYSLFIVSRFREELAAGKSVEDATVRTVQTAGKTVVFSAITVALSLAALLVFPMYFLRSFAYAGVAVALVAALGAVVSLPALLAVLGHRVDTLPIGRRRPTPVGSGVWHRVAMFVMRRPIPIATIAIVLLLVLGVPFLGIVFGQVDDRSLPSGTSSREVHEILRSEFGSNEAGAVQIALPTVDTDTDADAIDAYAIALSSIDGVGRVDAVTGIYIGGQQVLPPGQATARFPSGNEGTWLSVVPDVVPLSPAGEAVVDEIRSTRAPGTALVGGMTAQFVDSKDALVSRFPIAVAWIALSTFVLLFMMFGSVLVPVKALVINVLSLSATFGALVWIFQEGHLADTLGFTPTGTTDMTMPILMFCVAFGLSMDYEVFLLSRIKEEHDRGTSNRESVALGLERTGRIVTAAAVIISVIFMAFATSGVTSIKLFGIGLTIAVLMDAFVIRATLVPAFMVLAGNANWWAPKWMKRIYDRFGISEGESEPPPAPATDKELVPR